jgi:hypothetical protein
MKKAQLLKNVETVEFNSAAFERVKYQFKFFLCECFSVEKLFECLRKTFFVIRSIEK